ncbi:MAG: serine/threonine-protein kinase [Myxococcota bacterium]
MDSRAQTERICPQCGNGTNGVVCPIDGWATMPLERLGSAPAAPVDELGRWRTGALIAQEGGLAMWGGVETASGRALRIAVIALPPNVELAEIARVQRAAKVLEQLAHPRIARTITTGIDPRGDLVVVMEHVPGPTLGEALRSGGFGAARTARLGIQLFEALDAAHSVGVMHHDLTPERVRLVTDADGEHVVVEDVGLADLMRLQVGAGPEPDPTQLRPGTARYRAPEQARDRAVTRHADLYAVGAILYEMLTGRPVFSERTSADYLVAHLVKLPERPTLDGQPLEGPLVELILRCLEKKPWNRPDGAAAARDTLLFAGPGLAVPKSTLAPVIVSSMLSPPPMPKPLAPPAPRTWTHQSVTAPQPRPTVDIISSCRRRSWCRRRCRRRPPRRPSCRPPPPSPCRPCPSRRLRPATVAARPAAFDQGARAWVDVAVGLIPIRSPRARTRARRRWRRGDRAAPGLCHRGAGSARRRRLGVGRALRLER